MKQKIIVEKAKSWDVAVMKEQKYASSEIEMKPDHHHKRISCTYHQLKNEPTRNQHQQTRRKVYLSRPKPKQLINSVKANNVKVDSTVPGIKCFGDNTYAEYQIVNPHQQSQYGNTYISPWF